MIRHIFIGTFKGGIGEDVKRRQLSDMQAMKERIPGVADLQVGLSTGWAGQTNQVVMTVDFRTKADFDAYDASLSHGLHRQGNGNGVFRPTDFRGGAVRVWRMKNRMDKNNRKDR